MAALIEQGRHKAVILIKKEITKLKKEVVDLQGERDKEKETREAVELKYLEVKKQQRIALAEKVNEMRTSLGLEGENIEILSKSTEEALNTKIEVLKEDIPKVLQLSEVIIAKFKEIGFNYITLDLEGYRTGSMNETLR